MLNAMVTCLLEFHRTPWGVDPFNVITIGDNIPKRTLIYNCIIMLCNCCTITLSLRSQMSNYLLSKNLWLGPFLWEPESKYMVELAFNNETTLVTSKEGKNIWLNAKLQTIKPLPHNSLKKPKIICIPSKI